MKQKSNGHFSRFINWLMRMSDELPEINREKGGQDFFSKIMNRISN
ncbi:ferredoxin--nitrite reductase [Prochlorococcus marinus]|nr:ferredoxin--nitrite reductase [Prochlorococcus marinus]